VHRQGASEERTSFVAADAEALPLRDGSVQLLFANLSLPFCRPDRMFSEAARVLEAGGLFVFSTVGPDTLQELRRAWAGIDDRIHVHAAFDMHDLGDLALHSGLAEPVLDVDRLDVTYASLAALVRELRDCGAVNSAAGRRRELTGRARWQAFEARLAADVPTGERLHVTVELVLGQAWGRGPVVAKPRRAGPAEVAVPVERIGRGAPR
jgi:malonyl-CoA O-methyltransferase